jgi:hypothetical protein
MLARPDVRDESFASVDDVRGNGRRNETRQLTQPINLNVAASCRFGFGARLGIRIGQAVRTRVNFIKAYNALSQLLSASSKRCLTNELYEDRASSVTFGGSSARWLA